MSNEYELTDEEERKAINDVVAQLKLSQPRGSGSATAAIHSGTNSEICKYKDIIVLIITKALKWVPGLPSIGQALIIRLVTGVIDQICSDAREM
jgi:hypothetical protein